MGSVKSKLEIVTELRKLFAMMKSYECACLNPESFLDSLGIQNDYQQDATEFCQLLLFQTLEDPILHAASLCDPSLLEYIEKISPAGDSRCLEVRKLFSFIFENKCPETVVHLILVEGIRDVLHVSGNLNS